MNYADPFGVQETTPLNRALRRINLQTNQQLNWPLGYFGPDFLASINVVIAASAGLSLALPDLGGANDGTGFLIVNEGQYPVIINDSNGVQVTSVDTGSSKYFFSETDETATASWHVQTFGEGTSIADAIQLAGQGLVAIGGKLSMGFGISTTANNLTIDASYRGKIVVNNGGSVNIQMPQYTDVGNNFFVGFHNGGSGTMTLTPANGNTIDDLNSVNLAPNESMFVCCSGSIKWYTMGYGRSTQFQFTKLVKDISAGGSMTLTSAEASNKLLQFVGTPASNTTVVVPSVVGIYYVQNTYNGPYSLTIQTNNGGGLSLNAGDRSIIYCDGVNVVAAQSVAVGVNVSVIDGSQADPSINFSSETNTGLYKADLHTVGIASSGATAAKFSADHSSVAGKFGIGVDTPQAELHILSGAEAIRIQGTNGFISFLSTDESVRYGTIQGTATDIRYSVDDVNDAHKFFVGGVEVLEVNKTGIVVSGGITDGNGNAFATLGANTFTGLQVMAAQRNKIKPLGNVQGTINIDTSTANTFSLVCVGATTLNFTGSPGSGQDQTIYVKITNGNITWGSMCLFNNSGTHPVPTANGTDVFAVWYDPEQSKYVVGRAYQDYR